MALRDDVKTDVVLVFDIICSLSLAHMAGDEVEVIRIKETAGVLAPMTKALNVPFSRIARMYGKENSRTISSIETGRLKTVGGAINLTMAAAEGRTFDGV
ncbi:hypothetical protein ACFDR9_001347 [Janthinobacterium sp. CG_23.3]|uniref:hypothetical protein n=1 Tax=Janthinobacterium sp. CG_23.3 TaxID=3349634 RepID=UPI0038D35A80